MKRCPQCHRLENDETLKFCRADGAVLVNDSSSISDETGTARLGSGSVATELDTSLLPHRTEAQVSRTTGPTTALPSTSTGNTRELHKPGPRRALIVAMVSVVVVAIESVGYFVGGKLVDPGKDNAI